MGRPPVEEKSWIVEVYEKQGDGSDTYWRIPSERWLVGASSSVGSHDGAMHQRQLEEAINVFRIRIAKSTYWHGHTWRLRNLHTGEIIPWEGLE